MATQLVIFLMIGWSISSTIVNGSIFDDLRNWCLVKAPLLGKLLSCVRCSSFWIGLALFSILAPDGLLGFILPGFPSWMSLLVLPFLQSGFSVVVESLVIFLVKDRIINVFSELKKK